MAVSGSTVAAHTGLKLSCLEEEENCFTSCFCTWEPWEQNLLANRGILLLTVSNGLRGSAWSHNLLAMWWIFPDILNI